MKYATYLSNAVAMVSVVAGLYLLTTSALLGSLLIVGGLFIGWIANDLFSPKAMRYITFATCILMIPFIMIGSGEMAKKISWRTDASNAASTRPKKEVDRRSQYEKNLEFSLQRLVENTGKIIENQDDAQQKADLDSAALSGKLDAMRDFKNGDTSKVKTMTPAVEAPVSPSLAPPSLPTEELPRITIPRKAPPKEQTESAEPESKQNPPKGFRLPTQEDFMPPAESIPNTSPKEPTLEQRAKVAPPEKKRGLPKFAVCSCKNCKDHKHEITGWYDFDGNGQVEPIYMPCYYSDTGKIACLFNEFAWE